MTTRPPLCKCFPPWSLEASSEELWKLAVRSWKRAGDRWWFLGAGAWLINSKQKVPSTSLGILVESHS